jgi:hypothetical protein
MEAIKNLRESSVLLSNLGYHNHYFIAYNIYVECNVADVDDIIHDPSEWMDAVIAMINNCAELTHKGTYDALLAYATEEDYRAIYEELMMIHQWSEDEKAENFFDIDEEMEAAGQYDNYGLFEEEQVRDLSATMSNLNDDRSAEEKEDDILFEAEMAEEAERVLTPEEEEAVFDAAFYAQFGNCQCFGAPRTMVLGTSYDSLAECIYSFEYATTYVFRRPSDDLDIEEVKYAVLAVADAHEERIGNLLREEAIDADYRALYRELYILLGNDIADIEEEIYSHDDVPYSIEMRDGHRVVCPHFEQTIEADEIKEGAFFDEDFDLILDEETGKVKMVANHTRHLTEEMYEEMERLEVDDNFHASLCESDSLPF